MSRMLVGFGANAGIVGLFLPMARVVDQRIRGGSEYSIRIWGGFTVSDPTQSFGYVLLGFFVVLALITVWVMTSPFSRGKALVTLLFSVPATALALYMLLFHLRALPGDVSVGPGLWLMVGGASLASLGGLVALLRPDRTRTKDPDKAT